MVPICVPIRKLDGSLSLRRQRAGGVGPRDRASGAVKVMYQGKDAKISRHAAVESRSSPT